MTDTIPVPAVTVARYQAPRVHVREVTDVISSEPERPGRWPGHYQSVLVDTRTGELRFHESTQHLEPWDPAWRAVNDVPRETWKRWHPGSGFSWRGPHMWFQQVPVLLSWVIDSGVSELPYLDVAGANQVLADVAPHAQALLNGLFDADVTGADLDADPMRLEWSAASARAGRNIGRLCSRHRGPVADPEVDRDLVDFGDIAARCPQVYDPRYLGWSVARIDRETEYVTRFLGCNDGWHGEIKKLFGSPGSDGYVSLGVLGARAWYRTALASGDPRPLREFTGWAQTCGEDAFAGLTANTSDEELAGWVEQTTDRAAQALGVRLIGAEDAGERHRLELRDRAWDTLAVVGAEVARLERELEESRTRRHDLVVGCIGWGRSDSQIAERARMTRQAVNKIRD